MRNSFFVTFVFLGISISFGQNQTFLRGMVAETKVTSDSLDISYSIYLPKDYSSETPSKTLFVFDPEGEGMRAARLFVSAINGSDYIIVSNNEPLGESLDSLDANASTAVAIIKDVFLKVAVDKNEVYFAGLGSGAQVASALSYVVTNMNRLLLVDDRYYANQYSNRASRNLVMGVVGTASPNYYQMADYFSMMRAFNSDNSLYAYEESGQWPSAGFLGILLNRLDHLNADRYNIQIADSTWQNHYENDLSAVRNLIAEKSYLTAYDLVTDIKSDYRGNVDLDPLRDVQRSLRRSDVYKQAKRADRSGSLEETLLLDDISYFLEDDLVSANFENLGYWDERIRQFEAAATNSAKLKEQKVAKRMLGYIDYTVNDFLSLNSVALYPQRIFGNVLSTILDPKDYQAYLNIISLSAQDKDENTAYFYLEELLKQGYTDYESLYEIPETELLKINSTYNLLIKSYLGNSKF